MTVKEAKDINEWAASLYEKVKYHGVKYSETSMAFMAGVLKVFVEMRITWRVEINISMPNAGYKPMFKYSSLRGPAYMFVFDTDGYKILIDVLKNWRPTEGSNGETEFVRKFDEIEQIYIEKYRGRIAGNKFGF